jgi:hypothetical protein
MKTFAYYVLATEAFGKRMWFAGTAPADSGMGYQFCFANVIFDAYEFDSAEDAQKCLDECELTGLEVVPCEFSVSGPLMKGFKPSKPAKRSKAKTERV